MERVYLKDLGLQYNYSELENRNKTDMIVIHHTGNPTDDDLSAKEINASHKAQGWTCIGYHYVIRKDGTIEIGRPHWTIGAHAYGDILIKIVLVIKHILFHFQLFLLILFI